MSDIKKKIISYKNTQTMGFGLSIICMFLCAAYITVTVYGIQPGPLWEVLEYTKTEPLLFWLNFVPPCLLLGFFWFLTDRLFYSAAGVAFVFQVFSFINTMKITYRDDPLVPNDLALYREAIAAAGGYRLEMDWLSLGIIFGTLLLFLAFGWMFRSSKIDVGHRTLIVILIAFGLSGAFDGWYASKDLYFGIKKTDSTNMTTVCNELGFTYNFLYNFNAYPVEKPLNFDKDTAEAWNQLETEAAVPEKKPHIIFVMSEAFYDISNHARMASANIDPLAHFNEVSTTSRAISGNIVVPNFGGGTANTEFDVLTGMQTNLISQSGPSAFRVIHKNTTSLARVLEKQGYQSFFLHPGDSWFYNRQNVYRMLGMEDQIFEDAFSEEDYKGDNLAWVKDDACADKFIEEFERRTAESDAPVFTYMVTIQNHTAYNNNKYGNFQFPWVWTERSLSDYMAQEYLSVYLEGLRDADAMLGKLTSYFDQLDEPVILAFFGDHLPNLGADYLTYRELGIEVGKTDTVENTLRTYSPPFVVWANGAAAETTEFLIVKEQLALGNEETMSANYLGGTVLQLAGFSGEDPYFDFLNEMREQIPVIWKENYRLADGTYTNELDEEMAQLLEKLHCWQYYKLKYETVE
ncbi:MAG: sulfatase-like hydrolase/transferase [Firmicutes bacterium]|nr:sulfatase-like hydrolase/transferase [Bacillota bacterium]